MNNELQDKQYLALELTRILFSDKQELNCDSIMVCYNTFLKKLTDTIDEIETTQALKNQIKYLQEENDKLRANNQDVLKPLINDILTLVDGCKGDMEPYVYEAITSNCKRYEK